MIFRLIFRVIQCDFGVAGFSLADFHAFDRSVIHRVVALNCAERTGCLEPTKRRIEHLRALSELEKPQIGLRSALKKEPLGCN